MNVKSFKKLPFYKRQYIVEPKFQWAFMGYSVGTAVVVGLIFYGAVRFFFWKLAAYGVEAGLPKDHIFYVFLEEQLRLMNTVLAVTLVLVAAVLLGMGMVLSNKVAGPLFRFRRHLNNIASGSAPSPIQFRKGDWFQDLGNAYNEHLKRFPPIGADAQAQAQAQALAAKASKKPKAA